MKSGVGLLVVLAVGIFLTLSCVSAVTEIANYADVYLNYTGEMYGFKYLWTQNYSGDYDDFGGIVVEYDIGYTVSKNNTGNITAFNATTGSLIWTTYIGESDGTPLLDTNGDYIYINPGYSGPISAVYKLDKTSGAIVANNSICTHNMDSITQNEELVFQGCMNGLVYAYNKNDLSLNWTYNNSNFTYISMTPLYYDGTLLIGGTVGEDGVLTNDRMNNTFSLNATTGAVRWASNLTYVRFWDTQPSAENGVVFIGGSAGYSLTAPTGFLFAFNNTNGNPIWNITIGTYSQVALWDDYAVITNKGTSSSLAIVFVVNKTNGNKICNRSFGSRIYQGLSVVNGIGFFGQAQYGTNFSAINLTNCGLIYKNIFPASIFNPPAIARGKLYLKDDSKRLYSFDLGSGIGDWKYLGYDSTGRSSCTDCVTELKYVKSNCSGVESNYNCTLENRYNEAVYANLINSTGYNYSILINSGETRFVSYNSSGFSDIDINSPDLFLFDVINSTSALKDFVFNISDDSDILSCILYLNNSVNVFNSSIINKSSINTISYSPLSIGIYTAYVNCTDFYGYIGKSNIVSFEVQEVSAIATEVASVRSSGSNGSFVLSNSSFIKGITKNLRKGNSLMFNINNQMHSLIVDNISNDLITITVQSVPQTFVMSVGDVLNIDVNSDGVKDLEVSYLKQYTNLVSLKIRSIYLPYELPVIKNEANVTSPYGIGEVINSGEDKKSIDYSILIVSIILFVILLIVVFQIINFLVNNVRRKKR